MKKIFGILSCCLTLVLLTGSLTASAEQKCSNFEVKGLQSIEVTVKVKSVDSLYAAQLGLSYDADVLNLTEVIPLLIQYDKQEMIKDNNYVLIKGVDKVGVYGYDNNPANGDLNLIVTNLRKSKNVGSNMDIVKLKFNVLKSKYKSSSIKYGKVEIMKIVGGKVINASNKDIEIHINDTTKKNHENKKGEE